MWFIEWLAIGVISAIILSKMTAILQQIEALKADIFDLKSEILKTKNQHPIHSKPASLQDKTNVDLVSTIVEVAMNKPIEEEKKPEVSKAPVPLIIKPTSHEQKTIDATSSIEKKKDVVSLPLPPKEPIVKRSFEETYGARLPVWLGAIALCFAGFFLVKYSIENGILTEKLRMASGFLFGLAMLVAGELLRRKPAIAIDNRIQQAFTGAGIVVLYFANYASVHVYHLFSENIGFVIMAIISCFSMVWSLKHGFAIAMMGLIGGMLNPLLMGSHTTSGTTLFSYLMLVSVVAILVAKYSHQWLLVTLAWLGSGIWVLIRLQAFDIMPAHLYITVLFALTIYATYTVTNKSEAVKGYKMNAQQVLELSTGLVFILTLLFTFSHSWDYGNWFLLAILPFMVLFIVEKNNFAVKGIRFLPLAPVLLFFSAYVAMRAPTHMTSALLAIVFFILFMAIVIYLYRKEAEARACFIASGLLALSFYSLTYSRFIYLVKGEYDSLGPFEAFPQLYSFIALSLLAAAAFGFLYKTLHQKPASWLLLLASLIFTLFAFTQIFTHDGFAFMMCLLIFSLYFVERKFNPKFLREMAIGLGVIFGLVVLPYLGFVSKIASSFVQIALFDGSRIIKQPMIWVLASLILGASMWLYRQKSDDLLVKGLQSLTLSVGLLGGYCLIRQIAYGAEYWNVEASYLLQGVNTTYFALTALSVLRMADYLTSDLLKKCGYALLCFAILRLAYFDILRNPLFVPEKVGSYFLLNSLVFPYLLPIFWLREARKSITNKDFIMLINGVMLALAFAFISLNVRQIFQGEILTLYKPITNAEIYSYSVAWLLFAFALLFFGMKRDEILIRYAALGMMLLVVLKVFLYDAAALVGLFRVFSFLGLGLSLIALSWIFTKYVFKKTAP